MGRIIRTCSAAAFAGLVFVSSIADARTADPSALRRYGAGRLADIEGESGSAALAYAAALVAAPDNGDLALRAYREAIEAGDRGLAIRAARALEAQKLLAPDARLLLFSDRLAKHDWKGANAQLDRLEAQNGLSFLVPVLRAWTEFGAGGGDPLGLLTAPAQDSLIAVYAREHRALMLLALKRSSEGQAAVNAIATPDARGIALRLAAAGQLDALGNKAAAVDVLKGDDASIRAASALIEAGKPLGNAVNTPSQAIATLMARVAHDLLRDRASPAALTLARLASFAAPDDDMTSLNLAQALFANGKIAATLVALDAIKPASLFSAAVRELRVEALQRADRDEDALALAKAAAALPDASITDQVLLGQSYSRMNRHREAADTYAALIGRLDGADRAAKSPAAKTPAAKSPVGGASWTLWLLYGGALDAAKDWARAKPALRRAVELGVDQPAALNHLGYAMLEQGEALDEATRLIAKASALRPDDPAITDSLGWAFFKRGDTAQAIPILERAVATDPTLSETSEHLGDAYWVAGRRIDARYTWRAALVQADGVDATARLQAKIADGLAGVRK